MVICYVIQDHLLFVGVDKFENEGLIKYSQRYMRELDTPIFWFHVDDLSSPHAYVQLNIGETVVPPKLAQLCAQIVKDGSIEGVKRPAVDVIYVKCTCLVKSKSMKTGQVSFTPDAQINYIRGVRKDAALLKALHTVKRDRSLNDLEHELDDLIKGYKQQKKKMGPKDDDDWDDAVDFDNSPQPASITDGMTQAEFSTNLEDDFM